MSDPDNPAPDVPVDDAKAASIELTEADWERAEGAHQRYKALVDEGTPGPGPYTELLERAEGWSDALPRFYPDEPDGLAGEYHIDPGLVADLATALRSQIEEIEWLTEQNAGLAFRVQQGWDRIWKLEDELAEARAAVPEPLFTALFEVIDGEVQLCPQQVEAFDLPGTVVAVYPVDYGPLSASEVQRLVDERNRLIDELAEARAISDRWEVFVAGDGENAIRLRPIPEVLATHKTVAGPDLFDRTRSHLGINLPVPPGTNVAVIASEPATEEGDSDEG